MSKFHGLSALFIVVTIALDWWTKQLALGHIEPGQPIALTPFFNLVLVWNPGISFGMLQELAHGPHVLTALSLVICAVLVVWLWRTPLVVEQFSLSLIIGGALGNVIDRVTYGAVIDFIDLHVAGYHWPAFNLADSAITCGAVLLVLYPLFAKQHKGR